MQRNTFFVCLFLGEMCLTCSLSLPTSQFFFANLEACMVSRQAPSLLLMICPVCFKFLLELFPHLLLLPFLWLHVIVHQLPGEMYHLLHATKA